LSKNGSPPSFDYESIISKFPAFRTGIPLIEYEPQFETRNLCPYNNKYSVNIPREVVKEITAEEYYSKYFMENTLDSDTSLLADFLKEKYPDNSRIKNPWKNSNTPEYTLTYKNIDTSLSYNVDGIWINHLFINYRGDWGKIIGKEDVEQINSFNHPIIKDYLLKGGRVKIKKTSEYARQTEEDLILEKDYKYDEEKGIFTDNYLSFTTVPDSESSYSNSYRFKDLVFIDIEKETKKLVEKKKTKKVIKEKLSPEQQEIREIWK